MSLYIGPLAAAGTAFCWSWAGMFFGAAVRRAGPIGVNQVRLVMALLLLAAAHAMLYGAPWPTTDRHRLATLALSGLIGLAIGDVFLFRALESLGVKGVTVIMTLWPAMAFLLAWPMLGERPSLNVFAGMGVTLTGVALSVWGRRGSAGDAVDPPPTLRGVILALLGAFGQALGIVVAKPALADGFSPLSGTLVRMAAAVAAMWTLALFYRPGLRDALRPAALAPAFGGAFFGPFMGVTLSLLAVQRASVGVATTIMAVVPILVIPWMFLVYRVKPRALELAGAAVAVSGVGLLFVS